MKDIKELKRHLKLTNQKIAELFNYKSGHSFAHTSRRPEVEQGMLNLYNLITLKNTEEKDILEKKFVIYIIENYTMLRSGGVNSSITMDTLHNLRKKYEAEKETRTTGETEGMGSKGSERTDE